MLAWSVLLAVLCTSASAEFSYPEDILEGWTDLCSTGTKQSPIAIPADIPATVHAPITYKNYFTSEHNNKWYNGYLENNGHSVVWHISKNMDAPFKKCGPAKKCPSVRAGPFGGDVHTHAYFLLALHFHWGEGGATGSEHTIAGESFPLEMHMVHIEDEFIEWVNGTYNLTAAIEDPMGLAVLSVMFKVDDMKPQNLKPLQAVDNEVTELKEEMRELKEDDNNHEINMRNLHQALLELKSSRTKRDSHGQKLRLNPGAFIKKTTNKGGDKTMSTYYTYHGSLTTPDCNEVVTWVVYARPLAMAQVQVNAFVSLFKNNFRSAACTACALHGTVGSNDLQHLIHDMATKP